MLQLKTRFAPVPGGEAVAAFCSHHGLQQETVLKAAWAHLMSVYFDCNSITFRHITFEQKGASLTFRVVAGSEHKIQLGTRVLLEDLKAIETKSRACRAASQKVWYMQAQAEVDGYLLLCLFCTQESVDQDALSGIIQVGTSSTMRG
jgi:hypothetical protein